MQTIAGQPPFLTRSAIIDDVLDEHASALAADHRAYRNHVYRVANLCLASGVPGESADDKVAVAAVFHDLGIWTDRTFDYLKPSIALAERHLARIGRSEWAPEIGAAIAHHHQVSGYHGPYPLVEPFRRADWADVTRGLRAAGVPRELIRQLYEMWPGAGFHRRLVALTLARAWTHPLSPLPMLRW